MLENTVRTKLQKKELLFVNGFVLCIDETVRPECNFMYNHLIPINLHA